MPSYHGKQQPCACPPRIPPRQTVLVNKFGLLSISLPAPSRRAPPPHAVRRIANKAVFSTNDPSLSSFLRLPYELRLIIYGLLLSRMPDEIMYRICPVTRRLVLHEEDCDNPNYPCLRHGLYPAILECCRTIYQEALPVLYGENAFVVGCYRCSDSRVLKSWVISPKHFPLIKTVFLSHSDAKKFGLSLTECLTPFTGLRLLDLFLCVSPRVWNDIVDKETTTLARIPKIVAQFHFYDNMTDAVRGVYARRIGRPIRKPFVGRLCLLLYGKVCERAFPQRWRHRTWEFEDNSGTFEDDYDWVLTITF